MIQSSTMQHWQALVTGRTLSVACTLLIGCGGEPRPPAPWLSIGSSDAVRVSIDTQAIHTDSVGTRIQLRFDYTVQQRVLPEGSADSSGPVARVETQHYIECSASRVRDVYLQAFDSTSMPTWRHEWPPDSIGWISFTQHGASEFYFQLACETLLRLGKLPSAD